MENSYKELIRSRKSVRTFDGRSIDANDKKKLEDFLKAMEDPFGVPVDIRILQVEEYGLSSPVIIGAREYMAIKAARIEHHEIALGYAFESACLYAWSLGIGTVMLAATLSRAAFEKAMDVQANEVMPVASPLGYPADQRSVRETLMRKGIKSDERKPFDELFFRDSFEKPLPMSEAGEYADALELARWAPSATNQQPWRAVVTDDAVHFYEKHSVKENALGDIQKIDMGIALCHFHLAMRENGSEGSFIFSDPGIPVPEKVEYIASYIPSK